MDWERPCSLEVGSDCCRVDVTTRAAFVDAIFWMFAGFRFDERLRVAEMDGEWRGEDGLESVAGLMREDERAGRLTCTTGATDCCDFVAGMETLEFTDEVEIVDGGSCTNSEVSSELVVGLDSIGE